MQAGSLFGIIKTLVLFKVPKIYAQKVMQAHQLDSGESFDNITDFVAESKTDDLEKITQST